MHGLFSIWWLVVRITVTHRQPFRKCLEKMPFRKCLERESEEKLVFMFHWIILKFKTYNKGAILDRVFEESILTLKEQKANVQNKYS